MKILAESSFVLLVPNRFLESNLRLSGAMPKTPQKSIQRPNENFGRVLFCYIGAKWVLGIEITILASKPPASKPPASSLQTSSLPHRAYILSF
jgi:hypothetical protein